MKAFTWTILFCLLATSIQAQSTPKIIAALKIGKTKEVKTIRYGTTQPTNYSAPMQQKYEFTGLEFNLNESETESLFPKKYQFKDERHSKSDPES